MKTITMLLLILLIVNICHASEHKLFSGSYAITGGLDIDWEHKPGSSHLYLQINGQAAIDLYNALDTPATLDACTELYVKNLGNIYCEKGKKLEGTYCAFGIDLKANKIVNSTIC